MTTFGFVHGGFHGAWCWERLIPELSARGHDSIAMDMPIGDPDATLSDYVDAVVDALARVDEPVVLVGHSMGGLVIPHVARSRPAERMVFINAMFDNLPTRASGEDLPDLPSTGNLNGISFDGRVLTIDPDEAAVRFFSDCEPADVDWAVARLRPMGRAAGKPLVAPWPDVPSSVIVGTEDRSLEYVRLVVAPSLGIDPIELPGGHSPFLARPNALAQVLDDLASERATT